MLHHASQYAMYQTNCATCNGITTKKYARENNGLCKGCVTGQDTGNYFVCPDCGEKRLTLYQKKHHYHCDSCTRAQEGFGY